jgi:hypothetical protein
VPIAICYLLCFVQLTIFCFENRFPKFYEQKHESGGVLLSLEREEAELIGYAQ